MPSLKKDMSSDRAITHVGIGTTWQVFLRSLFLLAALNRRGMQSYGFAYALFPALRKLYPNEQNLTQAVERHLCCFNSHPYFSSAIVGGALHHEEKVARGEEPSDSVNSFKFSLMGPLAALGDGFFWLSLRPACGALGAVLALCLISWHRPALAALVTALFFLVSYNVPHVVMRVRFFWLSYRLGDDVVPIIAASRLPTFGRWLRVLASAGSGAVLGLIVSEFPKKLHFSLGDGVAVTVIGCGVLFLACYVLLARGISVYLLAYALAALTILFGLIF